MSLIPKKAHFHFQLKKDTKKVFARTGLPIHNLIYVYTHLQFEVGYYSATCAN